MICSQRASLLASPDEDDPDEEIEKLSTIIHVLRGGHFSGINRKVQWLSESGTSL